MDPKPSFDVEVEFPMPEQFATKVKIESRAAESKAIGERRHLPSNTPKTGLSMIDLRAGPSPKKKKDRN